MTTLQAVWSSRLHQSAAQAVYNITRWNAAKSHTYSSLVMVALSNRADHYIFILWFLSFYRLLFFPRLISAVGDLPYFGTWCGPSVNLECRSETCCVRLAGNTGRRKVAKNRHLGTIAQLCRVLAALLHSSQVVSVSQTLRRWTEGVTYVRQGDHHVGHCATFLVD